MDCSVFGLVKENFNLFSIELIEDNNLILGRYCVEVFFGYGKKKRVFEVSVKDF